MTTQISSDNIQPATLAELQPVTITSIQVTNSSWTPLDDSAVSLSGGYIVITGANFASGCNVIINSTNATSVAFVNSTTLRVQVPALSAGTYIVYISNPNGSTAIIVNGLTYSGTPTWVTVSPLTSGLSGVAISIQLSATGDAPITYAVQAGSTLPAGLTLTSGGLLSGTVSGLTSETTYNFTIEAIDPQLQDSPKAFAITIFAGDIFWDNVTLLLPGTTNTSIFNDDASTNNFAVSVFGDTRPSNFGPYTPGYYSNLFDGTGDVLTLSSNAALEFGSDDFTIELWYYATAAPSASNVCLYTNGTGSFYLQLRSTAFGIGVEGQAENNTFSFNFVAYQWYHLAVTRSGSTVRGFVNGALISSGSNIIFYSQNGAVIGGLTSSSQLITGYISNLRTVKGTAVYTASFTPPTTPLTAITNTSLLTCQSNRFIDNSTNNFTITRIGDVRIEGFDPFVPNSSYASIGSTYFDGTGDYLSLTPNSSLTLNGDYTIEFWIYFTSLDTAERIPVNCWNTAAGWLFSTQTNAWNFKSAGSLVLTYSTVAPAAGQWYHVAATRSGSASNNVKFFINGVQVAQGTNTSTLTPAASSTGCVIGGGQGGTGQLITGYISNFRIVKDTAVYTAAFTPPTQPLTAITNTSLLTCQTNQPNNNNMFLDSSTNNSLITRVGNTTQGTVSPYGSSWSNYCAGASSDYLSLTEPAATAGALTVEFWMYPVAQLYSGDGFIVNNSGSGAGSWGFSFNSTNRTIGLWLDSFSSIRFSSNTALTYNTWNHIALVKTSGVIYLYINGVQQSSTYSQAGSFGRATTINIGRYTGTGQPYTGYVSNLRMVYGTALYTTTFTPSTIPLQPITGTVLLTCADNRFIDDSPNNFAITRNGTVNAQKFSPFAGTTLPTPYYGAYFGTKTNSLSIPATTALTTFTGDFTFECWVYPTDATISTIWGIWDSRQSGSTANPMIFALAALASPVSGSWRLRYNNGTAYSGTGTVLVNQWSHVAFVRSGSTMTFYVNGVAGGTETISGTQTGNATSNPVYIGSKDSSTAAYGTVGYISNFRIVNGTAVYTTNFTPSTVPLTAIANTSLLTCQSATFIDNSTNNFAVSAVGNPIPTTFVPFTVTYLSYQSYSPSVFSGSMYFDGTGDYLELPANTIFDFVSSNFTIECWVFPLTTGVLTGFIANWQTGGQFILRKNASNRPVFVYDPVSVAAVTVTGTTTTIITGAWNHVAVVRNGSLYTMYVNGVADATTSTSAAALEVLGRPLRIGDAGDLTGPMNGYISDSRIIRGQALYTSNFVPPVAPLTPVTNTTMLVNGTSAGIYDNSMLNNSETVGGANLSTAISKFGGSSMSFDGTGDWIQVTGTNPSLAFGSGAFTVEFWFYSLAASGTQQLFDTRPAGTVSTTGYMALTYTGSLNYFTAGITAISGGAVSANAWHHVALTRSGTSTRLFVDGVQVGSTYTDSQNYLIGLNRPIMGADGNSPSASLTGYMQDIRITSGIARYTANFTAPTLPFQTN